MSDSKPPSLTYLFSCLFTDNSIIEQNPEDKSLNPHGKNCYSDVLKAVKEGKVIRKFSLRGKGNTLVVDLETGLFIINGLTVLLESKKLPALPEKFELIWYHQVTIQQNITKDNKTGKIIKVENLPDFREYFIGWTCSINGKEYMQKIAVA